MGNLKHLTDKWANVCREALQQLLEHIQSNENPKLTLNELLHQFPIPENLQDELCDE